MHQEFFQLLPLKSFAPVAGFAAVVAVDLSLAALHFDFAAAGSDFVVAGPCFDLDSDRFVDFVVADSDPDYSTYSKRTRDYIWFPDRSD